MFDFPAVPDAVYEVLQRRRRLTLQFQLLALFHRLLFGNGTEVERRAGHRCYRQRLAGRRTDPGTAACPRPRRPLAYVPHQILFAVNLIHGGPKK